MVAVAVLGLTIGGVFFDMLRTPAGIERETRIDKRKIYTRTRAVTQATPDEFVDLLQTDWSWWKKSRAERMKDLGDGRKEFLFHPMRFFNFLEIPPAIVVRLERIEKLEDGGRRIHARLLGDFAGPAEYTAWPGPHGTIVELAWGGAEGRKFFRFAPAFLEAALHGWRERLGVEGLRDRLDAMHVTG